MFMYLSTNAMGSNATAAWKAYKKGAMFSNPCFTQIHPTCIPVSGDYQSKLTLMSESLRNDGRIWVPAKEEDVKAIRSGTLKPTAIAEADRPSFGNLVPRDVASRNSKMVCDDGLGVGPTGLAVYLDFAEAIKRLGKGAVKAKYGNLFHMYHKITDEDPYEEPMKIYPAVHYTMGGLWVDYNLMTSLDGLFAGGETNFSDHGANRLGASALMQGLADGYFVLPTTISNYLAEQKPLDLTKNYPEAMKVLKANESRINKLLNAPFPKKTPDEFHRLLGSILWDSCGMVREKVALEKALAEIKSLNEEFWQQVKVTGDNEELNQTLERAGRVADFFELAELMCIDAIAREESCGAHFREEYQTDEGEALRDDENFNFVSAWESQGDSKEPKLHKEKLEFETVTPTQRSYK